MYQFKHIRKAIELGLLIVTAISAGFTVSASSNGITGYSGKQNLNCNSCHSGQDYNSSLSYSGSTSVAANTQMDLEFVLKITTPSGVSTPYAGIDIASSSGTLAVGDNLKVVGSELSHSAPVAVSNNQLSWKASWTAPSTAGTATIYACSLAVDRNLINTNDDSAVACIEQNITVTSNGSSEPEPEPTPEPVADSRLAEQGDVPTSFPNTDAPLATVVNDFDGDGIGDILYRHETDLTWRLDQLDSSSVSATDNVTGMSSCCGWVFNGSGDFNNDGKDDVIIRNVKSGQWYIYNLSSSTIISKGYVPIESAIYIGVQAVADFNNDGFADVLLRNENTGEWNMTLLTNRAIKEEYLPPMSKVLTWDIVDAKDFDGNGSADILIRNSSSGAWYVYLYNNTDIISRGYITTVLPTDLKDEVQGIGDFNGDGNFDVLFRNLDTNSWSIVTMNGRTPIEKVDLALTDSGSWQINTVNDFDSDGTSDISLKNTATEEVFVAFIENNAIKASRYLNSSLPQGLSATSLRTYSAPTAKTGTVGHQLSTDETENYYLSNISQQVVQSKCITCHTAGGVAAASRLHFNNSSVADYQALNQQVLSDFLALSGVDSSYLLDKAQGNQAHGGGVQLVSGSDDYLAMVQYLELLTGEKNNSSTTNFWEGSTSLNNKDTLRKAALIFAGRLPTETEYNDVADNNESSLRTAVKALMTGDGFHSFLTEGSNDRLLTEKFLQRGGDFLDANWPYFPTMAKTKYDMHKEGKEEEFWQMFQTAQYGFAKAPGELIAYIVENDKPYTEIMTADYTMVNYQLNDFYRGDATFDGSSDRDEFKPSHISQMLQDDSYESEYEEGFGIKYITEGPSIKWPHAGLLNEPSWLNRYPSTATNRNRARARWTYYYFLDFDIEKSAARTNDPDALADTNNPTMNNSHCTVCHITMDPVAGAYQNYGDNGIYRDQWGGLDSLSESYKQEWEYDEVTEQWVESGTPYVQGDTWYRDMRSPGFNGEDSPSNESSLRWLGQKIIADPRFAMASVKFWWPSIMGTAVATAPEEITDADYEARALLFAEQTAFIISIAEEFKQHWNLKDVLVDLAVSPWFRSYQLEESQHQLHDANKTGKGRLLSPELLDRKLKSLTGLAWNEHYPEWMQGRRYTELLNNYNLTYGGIDSDGVKKRAEEMTSVMSMVALAQAAEMACPIVLTDFVKADSERLLFSGIDKSTTPSLISSQQYDVDGNWAENSKSYSSQATLSKGSQNITISYLNDYYNDDTQLNRDLIIDRIVITSKSDNSEILNIQASEIDSVGSSTCGSDSWNETDGEETDFNIWNNCTATIPVEISEAGEYDINVHAYYMEWDKDGEVRDAAKGAGPAQMLVAANVSDPKTQTSQGANVIKQKLVELHYNFWGEDASIDDELIAQSYGLFVDSWQAKQGRGSWGHINEDGVTCNIDWSQYDNGDVAGWNIGDDPQSVMSAWRTIITYLMTDYRFLHE